MCLVGAIFLLAAFFRFYGLGTAPPGLFSDEAADAIDAAEAARTGHFAVFYRGNNGREGLFINAEALLLSVVEAVEPPPFHLDTWMARLPSALFGTLTVVGLFFLTRLLSQNDFAAGAAAFFAATSFWHINLSRLGVRPVSSAFFLVWSLFFLLLGFAENARNREHRGWGSIILAGVLYGAGFYTYISYRITPIIVVAVLIWLARGFHLAGKIRLWITGVGLFLGTTLLVVLPLALYFLGHPADIGRRTSEVSVLSSHTVLHDVCANTVKTLLMLDISGDQNPRHNIPGRPELFLPVGVLFLGGVILGIKRILQRSQEFWPFVLCFVWAVAGAIPAVLSNNGMPHALRSCLMIPPCLMLAALFADCLRLWVAARLPRIIWQGAVVALALLIGVEVYISYFHVFAHDPRTVAGFHGQEADVARQMEGAPPWVPKYFLLVDVDLDELGNPEGYENVALLSGGYTPKQRELRNIHFVTSPAEAERVRHLRGALIWSIDQQAHAASHGPPRQ